MASDPNYWRDHRWAQKLDFTCPGIPAYKHYITAWWCCRGEHMNDTTEKFDVRCRQCKHVYCVECEMTRNLEAKGDDGEGGGEGSK